MAGARPSGWGLTTPGPLRLYNTTELLNMPRPSWQIEPIIPTGGLVGIYGPPGCGKSFLAIDMALSIATNSPWQGHPVADGGFGLYVAAEGGVGITKRVDAWLRHHDITPRKANMGWLIEPMPLYGDSEDVDRLMGRVEEADVQPAVIVIDTLARCFDGDENTQLDMGRFVAGVDRLRHEFATTVIVVHHTRLGGDRERGNTAFRGAADTMIAMEGNLKKEVTISCNKQKDAEEFGEQVFQFKLIPGTDSGVLTGFVEKPAIRKLRADKRNRMDLLLSEVRATPGITADELLPVLTPVSMSRATMFRLIDELEETREITKENTRLYLPTETRKR